MTNISSLVFRGAASNSWIFAALLLPWVVGCFSGKVDLVAEKNSSYSSVLTALKKDSLYLSVRQQIVDSFHLLLGREEVLQSRESSLDEAVFFNKGRNKCVLLVLQTDPDEDIFGAARAIEGTMTGTAWNFVMSKEYVFGLAFFRQFEFNTFDNISFLARYCVMSEGKITREGCEIDEPYWFWSLDSLLPEFRREQATNCTTVKD